MVVNDCIWIRSDYCDRAEIFRHIRDALVKRGARILAFNGPRDTDGLKRIRDTVWHSDAHVIIDVFMPSELRVLKPIFLDRKHFSMGLVDWWSTNYWFIKNAEYLAFRNYNGIAVRHHLTAFSTGRQPPLFSLPDTMFLYGLASCLLRVPAFTVAPLLQIWKSRQRRFEKIALEKLLYFPFAVTETLIPSKKEPPVFDFSNLGSTGGYWLLRDPHAPAWLNFANLYYDRRRIIDLILQYEDRPYRVFDVRRVGGRMPWENFCRIVQQSRYAIATGGVHQNSAAKYIEFACFGLPMLGKNIPYEFPWLDRCLFQVDTLGITAKQLPHVLDEALQAYPILRDNCLALRETLLKMYNPHRLLDILQDQIDGKPVPPGYLKATAKASRK